MSACDSLPASTRPCQTERAVCRPASTRTESTSPQEHGEIRRPRSPAPSGTHRARSDDRCLEHEHARGSLSRLARPPAGRYAGVGRETSVCETRPFPTDPRRPRHKRLDRSELTIYRYLSTIVTNISEGQMTCIEKGVRPDGRDALQPGVRSRRIDVSAGAVAAAHGECVSAFRQSFAPGEGWGGTPARAGAAGTAAGTAAPPTARSWRGPRTARTARPRIRPGWSVRPGWPVRSGRRPIGPARAAVSPRPARSATR